MTCSEQHESDGIVIETIVSEHGYPYDVQHCKRCGVKMSAPISVHTQPERFAKLASAGAIARVRELGFGFLLEQFRRAEVADAR